MPFSLGMRVVWLALTQLRSTEDTAIMSCIADQSIRPPNLRAGTLRTFQSHCANAGSPHDSPQSLIGCHRCAGFFVLLTRINEQIFTILVSNSCLANV